MIEKVVDNVSSAGVFLEGISGQVTGLAAAAASTVAASPSGPVLPPPHKFPSPLYLGSSPFSPLLPLSSHQDQPLHDGHAE